MLLPASALNIEKAEILFTKHSIINEFRKSTINLMHRRYICLRKDVSGFRRNSIKMRPDSKPQPRNKIKTEAPDNIQLFHIVLLMMNRFFIQLTKRFVVPAPPTT